MNCIKLNCKRNDQVCINCLADLNVDQFVELTFLEGMFGRFVMLTFLNEVFKSIEYERESERRCNSDENCF